jgi:DNA-binding NtrC family response regulator
MEIKKRIAIISRNCSLRSALHDALSRYDLHCISFSSIGEFSSLQTGNGDVGLILYDVDDAVTVLPILVLAPLQTLSRDVPIIGLTGKSPTQLHRVLSGLVRKPFEMAELLSLIQPLLRSQMNTFAEPHFAKPSEMECRN